MSGEKIETIWLIESPVQMVEGQTQEYSIAYLGAKNIVGTTLGVHLDGKLICEVLGYRHTIYGNTLSFDISARFGDAGKQYLVGVDNKVDGNLTRRKFLIQIIKEDMKKNDDGTYSYRGRTISKIDHDEYGNAQPVPKKYKWSIPWVFGVNIFENLLGARKYIDGKFSAKVVLD